MKLIRLLKHDLAGEAERWCELGLVSREQASSVLELYGTELPSGEGKRFGYYALMAFAALFIGVALIIFLSHNWAEIPRALRFVGLLGLTITVNAFGVRKLLSERLNAARISFFFGGICYGASIFLVGQMYHLGEHFSNGLFLWALGVLPLGLLSGSVLVVLLSALISAIWFFVELGHHSMPWSYMLFCAAFFYFSLVSRRSILVFLTAVVASLTYFEALLSYAISGPRSSFSIDVVHVFFTLGAFLLLNTAATVLSNLQSSDRLADYGVALKAWVSRFGAITLLILCFEDPWKELVREAGRDTGIVLGTVGAYFLAHAGILTALWKRRIGSTTKFFWDHFSSIALGTCFALLSIGTLIISRNDAEILMVMGNLSVIGMGIWLIFSAVRNSTQSRFYLGVALLIALALIRYFDLMGGYIGGAAAFAMAGAIMFAAAKFWNRFLSTTPEVLA